MENNTSNYDKAFTLGDAADISLLEIISVSLATGQSLRMIIDNKEGEAAFCLLLLNMTDYEKWAQLLSAAKKP